MSNVGLPVRWGLLDSFYDGPSMTSAPSSKAAKPAATAAGDAAKASRGRPRKADSDPMGIQAVDIALDIIAALVARQEAMSLSELSRASDLQPSKLHRYLVSFTRKGLLRQSSVTGHYDFGPFARRIGAAAFNRHHGMNVVHEAVSTLVAEAGCTVYLYIWTELGPTLVRSEMGRSPMAVNLREGSALPISGSAVGRTFMAYSPASMTEDLLRVEREHRQEEGGRIWSDKELEREFKRIRSSRMFWTSEGILPDLLAVAPVFDAQGHLHSVIAAVPRREQRSQVEQDRLKALLESHLDRLAVELS